MKKFLTPSLLFTLLFLFSFLSTYSQLALGGNTGSNPYYGYKYSAGSNGTGTGWVNLGHEAGYSSGTGEYFTNVGSYAGNYAANMLHNTHIGYGAGWKGSSAQYNVAVGSYALYSGTGTYMSGDSNTAVGYQSSYDVTTGYNNTSLGQRSLYNTTSGYYNVAVGSLSGDAIITGYFNTFLGSSSGASSTSAINQTAIGYGADGQANNSVTLGNSDVTAVYMAEDSGATVYAAGLNLGSTAVTSTAAELNYVDGVTSNVQTQLDSKQATITGAATTITSSDLTVSRALTSNGSGKVEVVSIQDMSVIATIDGLISPRYITKVDEHKAYISDWGINGLHILDLTENKIIGTISCGTGPEKMVVANGNVYVCNVGGWGFDNTVSVIDIQSDMVINTIQVGDKPNSTIVDANGDVWVLSSGYTEYNSTWTEIISQTQGSLVRISNGSLQDEFVFPEGARPKGLMINGQGTNMYFSYNSAVYSFSIVGESSIPIVPLINRNFYGLSTNGNFIYGTDAVDYVQNGWSYRYSTQGVLIDSTQVGIIPGGHCFIPNI